MNKILLSISLILLISCDSDQSHKTKLKITSQQKVTFDVGFPCNQRFIDVFNVNNEEHYYFCDVTTHKKIQIFSSDYKLKYTIPLNEVLKECNNINNVGLIHPDTVLVLSQYTNMLFWINSKGECYNKVWMDTITNAESDDYFQLGTSVYQSFVIDNKTLLFSLDWYRDLRNPVARKVGNDYIKYYYNRKNKAANFLKVKIDGTKIKAATYGLEGFYHSVVNKKEDMAIPELPYENFGNGKVFKTTFGSNKVFIIDTANLEIVKQLPVQADSTSIGTDPFDLKSGIHNMKEWIRKSGRFNGGINRVLYDQFNQLYYIFVFPQVPESTPDGMNGDSRKWYFLVYDTSFNKIGEVPFSKEFNGSNTIITSKGILIGKHDEYVKDYDPKKAVFELFTISK